jgi:hypothetical protein
MQAAAGHRAAAMCQQLMQMHLAWALVQALWLVAPVTTLVTLPVVLVTPLEVVQQLGLALEPALSLVAHHRDTDSRGTVSSYYREMAMAILGGGDCTSMQRSVERCCCTWRVMSWRQLMMKL